MRPMMKLFSQFEHVASATPFALTETGERSQYFSLKDGFSQKTDLRRQKSLRPPRYGEKGNSRSKKIANTRGKISDGIAQGTYADFEVSVAPFGQ